MSLAAVRIPSHGCDPRTMIDAMARPHDSWTQHESSYAARRAPFYVQEQSGQPLRLPPPSSLVPGPGPYPGLSGRGPAACGSLPHRGSHPTSSLHAQHVTQFPPPDAESHAGALTAPPRRPAEPIIRLSPTPSSTTTSDRSEDVPEPLRLRQLGPEPSSLHASRPELQIGALNSEPPGVRYAEEGQQMRQPPGYPPRDAHQERSPRATTSPRDMQPPHFPPRPPERMRISDLLSGEPASDSTPSSKASVRPATSTAAASSYRIRVRQQPVAARSCGFGERDRRVIDPPPIVQVTIEDPTASEREIDERIRYPFSVMNCRIFNEAGDEDMSAMPEDFRQQRRLMGTIVSSPFVGKDENDLEGCFFAFPDLSVRTPGSFRLQFQLVLLNPQQSTPGCRTPVCATAMSDVFTVYNAKDFPGMKASTALTKRLKAQGCPISIKKGNERNRQRDDSEDDDDDDEDDNNGGRRAKRPRRT